MTEASAVRLAVRAIARDFSIGSFTGSLWSFMLLGHFGRNSLFADLLLLISCAVGYSAFWTFVSWTAHPRAAASSRAGSSGFSSLFVVSVLSVYMCVLLSFYLPARGVTWFAVGATCLILILVSIGGRSLTASALAQRVPSPRFLNYASLVLLAIVFGGMLWEQRANLGNASLGAATPSARQSATVQRAQVTLLGSDGVDWVLLNRLVAEGLLPNIKQLMEEGVAAPLQTFSDKSPLIWTSIATGVTPEAHGVRGFVWPYLRGTQVFLPHSRFDFIGKAAAHVVDYREMRPFSSSNRTARAIWEIASLLDRRVLLVNWWATYPAEAVRGAVVSDYSFPSERIDREELQKMSQIGRLAFPEGVQRVAFDTMLEFVGDRRVSVSEDPEVPAQERNDFFVVRDQLAARVFHALDDPRFDIRFLFLNAADAPSHIYTFDVFGDNVDEVRPPRVPQAQEGYLWDTLVVDAYIRLDEEVGQTLRSVGEKDLFLMVSDHGWRYDGTSHWRRPEGVLVIRGPGIRRGLRIPSAHVYDVFPTLCYLLGLPISEEVEGRVVWNAFEQDFVHRNVPQTVRSYGKRSDPHLPSATELDRDHIERLRSLGYVE